MRKSLTRGRSGSQQRAGTLPRSHRRGQAQDAQTVTLDVGALAPGGDGVGREADGEHAGRVVFVTGAAPGDRVRARVVLSKSRWARAELVEILEPGAARTEPFCPIWSNCGGCEWQHVSLDAQRAAKRDFVQRIADQLSSPDAPVTVPPVAPSPDRAWRQRARARFESNAYGVAVGFLGRSSHRLVDVPACPVAQPGVQTGMNALREALADVGDSRGTAVFSASASGAAFASVRVDGVLGAHLAAALEPRIAGGVVSGIDGVTAFGARSLDVPAAPGLCVRPGCFTQANPVAFSQLTVDLLAEVDRLAPRTAADLFAGAGTLTLPLAGRVPDVLALEGDADAVEDLLHNAAGLPVRAAVVDLFLDDPLTGHLDTPPDLVVMDPPREGAAAVARALAALGPPAILSVACDPQTQARDLQILRDAGYRLASLRAYDAFPHTAHVETLALMLRLP